MVGNLMQIFSVLLLTQLLSTVECCDSEGVFTLEMQMQTLAQGHASDVSDEGKDRFWARSCVCIHTWKSVK